MLSAGMVSEFCRRSCPLSYACVLGEGDEGIRAACEGFFPGLFPLIFLRTRRAETDPG
jgi:hypothetical protein